MRIGIVTLHFANNYGAALQAYALQTCLRSQGHEAAFVDYRPRYMTHGGSFRLPRNKRDLHANASVLLVKLGRAREALRGRSQRELYDEFRREHFELTAAYYDLKHLRETPPTADAYICGSDQIWNPPSRYGVDPAYFLDFGRPQVRRISYAASFGRPDLDADYREPVGKLLQGLDAISVREESGVELVRRLSGREAYLAPDPTVLLDDYSDVMRLPEDKNFCFLYCLRSAETADVAVQAVKKHLGLESVTPFNPIQHWKSPCAEQQMGPAEWLGHVRAASFVVANSFHATMFSVIFNRPFVCLALGGRNERSGDRMRSLLGRLGLADRIVPVGSTSIEPGLLEREIDWPGVNARLSAWREEATAFLAANLNPAD